MSTKEIRAKHYKKNREVILAKTAERRKANEGYIRSQKLKCTRCEEDHPACLEFHHTDDNKDFAIGDARNFSLERLKAEIEKCVVLCGNCHRKEHYPDV